MLKCYIPNNCWSHLCSALHHTYFFRISSISRNLSAGRQAKCIFSHQIPYSNLAVFIKLRDLVECPSLFFPSLPHSYSVFGPLAIHTVLGPQSLYTLIKACLSFYNIRFPTSRIYCLFQLDNNEIYSYFRFPICPPSYIYVLSAG